MPDWPPTSLPDRRQAPRRARRGDRGHAPHRRDRTAAAGGDRQRAVGHRRRTGGDSRRAVGHRQGERVETSRRTSDTAGERSDTVDEHAEDAEKHTGGRQRATGGLWQRLGLAAEASSVEARREFIAMGSLACAAAVAVKAPELFGLELEHFDQFYARNLSLLVLPFLAGYFAWKRRLAPSRLALLAAPFVAVAVIVNVYRSNQAPTYPTPRCSRRCTCPSCCGWWSGFAHVAGDWRSHDKRMDFVRFTGEWCLYYGLIALGGGCLRGVRSRDIRRHRPRRRPVHRALAGAVRSGRRRGGGRMAGRVEARRAGEDRPRADKAVHADVRGTAGRVPHRRGPDRQRNRRRAEAC